MQRAWLISAQYGECAYPEEDLLSLPSLKIDKLDTISEIEPYGKPTARIASVTVDANLTSSNLTADWLSST
jgi:uncharacterized protein (UPF0218 family)